MRIFKNYGTTPDARAVAEAAEALREGQIIIYPTDTLYAFGCDGLNNRAIERLRRYLPGPYTFILPASLKLPKVFKGRKSVGIRIPDNSFSIALARELGGPVMTSSVTPDDDADLTDAEAIALKYDGTADLDLTIDGGPGHTTGSTVVDLTDSTEPSILRQGLGEFAL